jgi:hypothetical protein
MGNLYVQPLAWASVLSPDRSFRVLTVRPSEEIRGRTLRPEHVQICVLTGPSGAGALPGPAVRRLADSYCDSSSE